MTSYWDARKLGLLLGNLLLGAAVIVVAHLAGRSQDAAQRVEYGRDAQAQVNRIRRSFGEIDAARRGYIISPRQPFLEDLHAAEQEVTDAIAKLQDFAHGDAEAERRAGVLAELAQFGIADSRLVLEMAKTYPFQRFVRAIRGFREKPERLRLYAVLDSIEAAERERIQGLLADHVRTRTITEVLLGAAALVGLVAFNYAYLAGVRLDARRAAAERALRNSQAQFRMFMEQLPAAIFIKDDSRRRTYVNRHWERTFGWSFEAAQQRSDADLWEPAVAAQIVADDLDVLQRGEIKERIQAYTTADGAHRILSVYRFPLTGETGERFIGGAAIDVTDYENNRRELQRYAEQLEAAHVELVIAKAEADRANQAKRDFLASMSHEIRTPLNGVLGVSSLLRGTELDSEQQELAELIHGSAQALLTILNDVLDFSKIEAGRMELDPQPFQLTQLVQRTVALFTPKAATKGLWLTLDFNRDAPDWVIGDGPRLQQILANLVNNAVKFTDSGGVRVRVEYLRPTFRISVEDTGIGIPLEAQGRLFQQFAQADPSVSRHHGGTGLGLAIARQLTELMGGWIELESTVGAGSRFTVVLALEPAAPEGLTRAAAPMPGVQGMSVLLAEDNAVNQRVSSRLLERLGCQVEIAEDGEQAVAAFDPARHRLILMDCSMPVCDGYEATRRLRELHGRQVPIVALTADAVQGTERRCLEAGMDGYITKPVSLDALAKVLGRWSAQSGAPGSTTQSLVRLDTATAPATPALDAGEPSGSRI